MSVSKSKSIYLPPRIIDGFVELVRKVITQYPAGVHSIPSNQNQLWEDFVSCGLISGQLLSCHTNYVYEILYSHGLTNPKMIASGGWLVAADDALAKELIGVTGLKQEAITYFRSGDDLLRLGNSLASASNYFASQKVSKTWLISRTKTLANTNNLMVEIAYPDPSAAPGSSPHIYNYGITKTVLWLHGYSLASHLSPDSSQVQAFVSAWTGVTPSDMRDNSPAIYWSDYFTYYVKPLGQIALDLSKASGLAVSVRDAQLSAWILYSTKTLVKLFPLKNRRKLTGGALNDFIDKTGRDIKKVLDEISDIDSVNQYSSDVYAYLSTLP